VRKSREATAQSKARIVNAASRMVRERGIDATSVADVMVAAGMTNGGFYRHFRSKDEMIALAIGAAFAELAGRYDGRSEQDGAEAAMSAYVEEYLSEGHLEHPELGCPMASAGAEAARNAGVFAQDFAAGAEEMIKRLATGSHGGDTPDRAKAIRCLATLVGAVVIARAVGRSPLRDEILAACKPGLSG
jgi:TetR/AcrR family transcriptional repressor of nem operon